MRQTFLGQRFWVVAAVAAALSAMMGATVRAGLVTRPAGWLQSGLGPVERAVATGADAAAAAVQDVAQLWHLRQENEALRAQVARLQLEVLQAAQVQAQNQTLRQMLRLQQGGLARFGVRGITAAVVGRDPSTWFDTLVVDKGSREGVRPGMIAVTPDGLAGRVVEPVGLHSATLMLVTDPEFGVGGMVRRPASRAEGVVQGRLGATDLVMTFFSPSADVRAGDTIVTSGIDGTYPEGLPVGTVVAVHRGGLVLQATVQPVAGLDSVEAVLLLPPEGSGG